MKGLIVTFLGQILQSQTLVSSSGLTAILKQHISLRFLFMTSQDSIKMPLSSKCLDTISGVVSVLKLVRKYHRLSSAATKLLMVSFVPLITFEADFRFCLLLVVPLLVLLSWVDPEWANAIAFETS